MNEYRGGEMSTEVVVDGNCGPYCESVLRAWLHGARTLFEARTDLNEHREHWQWMVQLGLN